MRSDFIFIHLTLHFPVRSGGREVCFGFFIHLNIFINRQKMRRLCLWLVFFVMLGIQSAFAQSYVVKGNVVSKLDNEPLIGVSILQKGTTNGVVTDMDGNYELKVQGGDATLVFSYIGMRTQELPVDSRTGVLNVAMEDDSQLMDEVVVVAYGVRKKGTIAGSVSMVKAEKMENVPAPSFDQALQGQAPGLSVIANSGEPSKAAVFQIRGTNSINSGTAPLFILDGVPIESSDFNTISPSDIESVSVLKDASSTSIYGARASNGVVVITTKRGLSMDKAKVTLRAQYGFSNLARTEWNMMNTAERIEFEKLIGMDTGQDYNLLARTDVNWMDAIFKDNAPLQSYEISINRATEKVNYYVSGGFYDQDGIAPESSFRRYNIRANAEVKASNWLKVGTNTMAAYEEIEQTGEGSSSLANPIFACRLMLPYWNPYKEDGSFASQNDGTWAGTDVNPLEWMANNPVMNKKYKLLSTVFAEITPIQNLTIRSQFGVDYSHSTGDAQSFPSYIINNGQGSAGRSSYDTMNLTETTTANYRWTYKDDHAFNFMLGQEAVSYMSEGFQVYTDGQTNDLLTDLSSGTRASSWANSYTSYSYLSFFGRAEYNYKDLYYADFSVRGDASSRFGKNNRWGGFWSIGLMWNAKGEKFLKNVDWLTNAQVALSTGTTGNSEIPDYDHLALVAGGPNYNDEAGIYPAQSENEDLSWETTWTTNLAFHLGFIDRINVDIELYNKRTTNMLMYVPESYAISGEGSRWENVGAMVNRGIEVNANADVLRIGDFSWNLNANISYNKNELKELYNGVNEYVNSTTGIRYEVGHPVSEYYMVRYAGVNPANGEQLWYTKDGEITNEYSEEDRVMTGKTFDAPWAGGFGTTLSWKGLSFSAQFSWLADRWVMNNDRYFEENNGSFSGYNQSKRLLYDGWKKPGDVTDIPRYGEIAQLDDRFLENTSFLRLKNVTIAYSLPRLWLQKSKFFTSARVYLQGQNLLTFTGFSGFDPEYAGNRYLGVYPASRQFTFGVEVSF